jgi:hypothetical protein
MRSAAFSITILLAASAMEAAPAPIYREPSSLEAAHRALPKALREEIESEQRS